MKKEDLIEKIISAREAIADVTASDRRHFEESNLYRYFQAQYKKEYGEYYRVGVEDFESWRDK